MRTDDQQTQKFRGSSLWNFERGTGGGVTNVIRNPEGSENKWTAFSHSGNERNRLFMNERGDSFVNLSAVSGVDVELDSRSFVKWDLNRDGRVDIALVNANEPLLQVFENRVGVDDSGGARNQFIAVKLTGGNQSPQPSKDYSNRDAVGARLIVDTGDMKLTRVLSAGEGFASQNSRTLIVGIGEADRVPSLEVIWPSGEKLVFSGIEAGILLEIDEKMGKIARKPYVPAGK